MPTGPTNAASPTAVPGPGRVADAGRGGKLSGRTPAIEIKHSPVVDNVPQLQDAAGRVAGQIRKSCGNSTSAVRASMASFLARAA